MIVIIAVNYQITYLLFFRVLQVQVAFCLL